MNIYKYSIVILTLFLAACNPFNLNSNCPPNSQISWVDMVMINDIQYMNHQTEPADEAVPLTIEKGGEIGKVTYKMAGSACSDHRMKNGDAAFWDEGTAIFDIKGYPSSLLVLVGDRVYVAYDNKKADTAGELYPMKGLVKNIHIQSTEDGRRIHTFSQTSKEQFLEAFYPLEIENHESLYKEGKFEGERVFLEIELNNGVSFRELYWADSNVFHSGIIGNAAIKEVIDFERSQ